MQRRLNGQKKETGIAAKDIERIANEFVAMKPKAVLDWGWRTATSPEEIELRKSGDSCKFTDGNVKFQVVYSLRKMLRC